MKRLVATLALLCTLGAFGVATANPAIRHAKICTQPAGSDPNQIGCPDWNADHVIDQTAFGQAIHILVVNGDPNGTVTGSVGDLARDTTGQLWLNTTGGTTWTAFVRADSGQTAPRKVFLLRTDSNGMGAGTETDQDDPADAVNTPNTNVNLVKIYTTNFSEPVTPINMGTGALRVEGFFPAHGPELAIGFELNRIFNGTTVPDSAHKLWIDQMSIHSSTLANWMQGSTAGTLSPLLGGSNLDGDSNARGLTTLAASSGAAAAMFTMLGTNDASNSTDAGNLGTNIAAFETRQRSIYGAQLLFVWTVIQSTITNPPFPSEATARANQIAALQAATGTALVYAEDIPTIDDFAHFTSIGEQVLGARDAFAYVRLAGLRERTVTTPTVVGFSPATYNGSAHGLSGFTGAAGATIRAWPWQGSTDHDLVIMPVFSGSIGAGSSIPTPSGYTLSATQIASTDAGGVGNHVALFTKQVLQADLDANTPSTGGPGFPASVTVTPGGAQFVTKPFTVRAASGTPAFDGAATAFTHTAVDTAAVTAGGVTTTAPGRTIFILVTAWSAVGQSFTVTNGSLTGLAQVYGAQYPSSSGNFLYIGLWTGTLAGTGASGNSTVTPAINASSQGYTWAM